MLVPKAFLNVGFLFFLKWPSSEALVRPTSWSRQKQHSHRLLLAAPEPSASDLPKVDDIFGSSQDISFEDVFGSPKEKSIEDIFGAGQGKHAGKESRSKKNKYKTENKKHKAGELDPFEKQLVKAKQEEERLKRERMEETREEMRQRRRQLELELNLKRERGMVEFPDEEDIDPYDPTTFGFIRIGYIMGPHGVKGEVKVAAETDFGALRLGVPGPRHVQAPGRRFPREIELEAGRPQVVKGDTEVWLVKFRGVGGRAEAEALRGHVLFVRDDEGAEVELDEGEYMLEDLVGLPVYLYPEVIEGEGEEEEEEGEEEEDDDEQDWEDWEDDELERIGTVSGIVLAEDLSSVPGLADLLEIEYEEEDNDPESYDAIRTMTCLVPFVEEIVPLVDLERGRVMLSPPPGLLNLAVVKREKVFIRGYLPENAAGMEWLRCQQQKQ